MELAPDRVADAPLQCPERFLLRLALDEFAFVVDASGGVVRDLGDRDEMHRMVQFAVPARVQPILIAKGKIMKKIRNGMDPLSGQHFSQTRADSLGVLHRGGEIQHG